MGCEKNPMNQTFIIGKQSIFRINQLYYSTDGQYTLMFNEINDSRCPEGGVCVWAGEVYLIGEWTNNQTKTTVELHTLVKGLQKIPDGFTMQIMSAIPYPKLGAESNAENLVITLLIQKI